MEEDISIEEVYIEAKKAITQFSYIRSIKITTARIQSFLRELSIKIDSLGYELSINWYEPLSGEIDYIEVLGVFGGKKEIEGIDGLLFLGGVFLIIIGIVSVILAYNFAWVFILVGILFLILSFISGSSIPENPDELIVLCEGIESSGIRKRDIKIEDGREIKGVELTYRVAELDFVVGGTDSADVDDVISFLERYKAIA